MSARLFADVMVPFVSDALQWAVVYQAWPVAVWFGKVD